MPVQTKPLPVTSAEKFDHISFSALSLYAQCPLRFMFRYIQGLPEEFVGASLVFGSAIHASLQHHFEQLLVGSGPPALDTLLDVYQDAWRSHDGQVQFSKGDDINTLGRLAEKMLRAFQASGLARVDGTILAVEEEIRGVLVPGVPDLLARVDLIVETEEALVVRDFKTSRRTWSNEQAEDASPQLLLYSELVKNFTDRKLLKLQFLVLSKTQVPEITLHEVPVSSQQIERTKKIAERVWKSIECGNFYPAPSPLNCPSCPYRQPCRRWLG